MEKLWTEKESAPDDFFSVNSKYPKAILQILWNRGIKTPEDMEKFFNVSLDNLIDPEKMLNMKIAAERIISALKNNERMAIWGDYDTDGVSSVAIVFQLFKKLGYENFDVFIPNRFKSGYGLTIDRIKKIYDDGGRIIVVLDCGITDIEEVDFANSLGMEVIIFDHHLPHDTLPKTLLVDPTQPGDSYEFKYLSATGLAYKLSQEICRLLGKDDEFRLWQGGFLELVAIATIADVAPVLGENRILIRFGLEHLVRTGNIGLKALFERSGLADKKTINSYQVGFIVAPRFNAVGRVEHSTPSGRIEDTDYSFELIVAESENEANVWADKVCELNLERQKQMQLIYDEIDKTIGIDKDFDKVIFIGSEKWSRGLIGIVAGKLKDKWHRPSLVCSKEGDVYHCSGRSIPGYNLVEVIDKRKDLFLESGGHSLAAGFGFEVKNFEACKNHFNEQANLLLQNKDLVPILEIEGILNSEDLTSEFMELFRKLEPFGRDNPEPVFLMKDIEVLSVRFVGNNGAHTKLSIRKNNKNFNVISFNSAEKLKNLQPNMRADVVFMLRENEWQGQVYLDLELLDIKVLN